MQDISVDAVDVSRFEGPVWVAEREHGYYPGPASRQGPIVHCVRNHRRDAVLA